MTSLFDAGPFAPCPAPFNLAAYVLAHARDMGEKPALEILHPDHVERWSYGALESAVRGIATGLLARGLKSGDKILMRLGNTVDFPLSYLGAITAGMVPVPTSAQLTAREVSKMVSSLAPAAILYSDGIALPENSGCHQIGQAELKQMHALPPADFDMGDPERLAYIVYTSGTSGQPRAVCHAHRAIWARRMMHEGWYGLRASDRLLHAGGFNWTFTLGTGLMDPWSLGATALIPAEGTDPATLPDLLREHKASIFAAAPGVYRKMLNHPDFPDLPDLRHGLAAGEKLSAPLRAAWHSATGGQIYEAYGMSECSTFISSSPSAPAHDGAIGRPQTGRRVALIDAETGDIVPRGSAGTIAVHRSDMGLMLGYFGAEDETAAKYAGDWFMTGDQGVMDENSEISYLGRLDDMMNAGGFRVSPLEVEAALLPHPQIHEVGVIDIEVKQGASVIMAFYTSDEELDEEALGAFAATRLARYKQPRAYIRLPHLPLNPNGKLSRRALKSEHEARLRGA
ncbi:class I adenylate-forming enzyme family protein [Litorivita sp. NS0012-18]|uniref:class I adenylate-forming enzyme family protein n=1 Tax=Litorivita sp. NS0012-18 TaxID=3127655 RepID=UPI003102A1D2